MTEEEDRTWPPKELSDWSKQQAQNVRHAASEGGLRFQAYLPPALALWLLDRIEKGMFIDPSEAVFVLVDEARELEPHLDLRQDLLKRRILKLPAIRDPVSLLMNSWPSLKSREGNHDLSRQFGCQSKRSDTKVLTQILESRLKTVVY